MSLKADMSDSAYDFQRAVWPAIATSLGGGRLIPVETVVVSGFSKTLDVVAGIDAWHVDDGERGMRGIASRVQWGPRAWESFTVRRSVRSGVPTEFEKRTIALSGERGYLYPHVTVHAYVATRRTGDLLSCAVIRTEDLISLCDERWWRPNPSDGSTFYYVDWSRVRAEGTRMFWWPDDLRQGAA